MKQADYIRLTAQIAVLKEIAVDYSGKTIDNIIQQLEAIKKEVKDEDQENKEALQNHVSDAAWLH